MEHKSAGGPQLSIEQALWALIAVLALATRLGRLGSAPLSAAEARQAIVAWRAASGLGMPLTGYNPVLLWGNSLLFSLFGASDAVARLLPALCGAGLALLPLLLKRELGRAGAIVSGLYLALSPTALVASRQLNGTIVSAAGTMAFLGAGLQFWATGHRRWIVFAGAALALAVAGGPTVYGLLLPLGVGYGLVSLAGIDVLPITLVDEKLWMPHERRRFLVTFGVGVLLLSTGAAWNLSGLEATGGLLGSWLGRFGPTSNAVSSPLTLLTAYEPWVLVFGLGGAIWGVLKRDGLSLLLALWGGLALTMTGLMPGREPVDLLWVVLPLTMLSASFVAKIGTNGWGRQRPLTTVHLGIALVLWAHAYLQLGRYAAFGDGVDLGLAVISVLLQGLVALSFSLILGGWTALRVVLTGATTALIAFTVGAGWGVAYRRPADPREALWRSPTPGNIRDLVDTLEVISWSEDGVPTTLDFAYEAPVDSVLTWYLRDFADAERVSHLADLSTEELGSILVTADREEEDLPETETGYAGQDFPIRWEWSPRELGCGFPPLGCRAGVRWLLFRESVPAPEGTEWATLWRAAGDTVRD